MNGVIEKARKKTEVSIAVAADAIGIPRVLIDIRHGKQLQLCNYNMEILVKFLNLETFLHVSQFYFSFFVMINLLV